MPNLYRTRWPHVCRRCLGPIAAGDAAIHRADDRETASSAFFYHPDCLIDVDPEAAILGFESALAWDESSSETAEPGLYNVAPESIGCPKFRALRATARKRADQWRARHNRSVGSRRSAALRFARPSLDRMSRDRQGRPRVSLLCVRLDTGSLGDERVFVDSTLVSSRREYVLVEMTAGEPVELPWQPFIGALCIVSPSAKPTRRLIERFVRIEAMGIAAPMLVLLGPAGAARDRCERTLRGLLDESGFAGDLAVSFCAETLDAAAAAALGAALDETLSIEAPDVGNDGRASAVAVLEEICRDEREPSYVSALVATRKRSDTLDAALRARASRCAAHCLGYAPARRAAVELLSSLAPLEDPAPLRTAWLAELGRGRDVSKLARLLEAELVRCKDRGMWSALLDVLRAEKKRSTSFSARLALLRSSRDRAIAADLKTWADSTDAPSALELRATAWFIEDDLARAQLASSGRYEP
jgi:hypothetical protein